MNHSTRQYIVMATLLTGASGLLYAANQLADIQQADNETTSTTQTQPSETTKVKASDAKTLEAKVVVAEPTTKPVISDDASVKKNDSQTDTNTPAPSVAKSNRQFIPTESISEDLAVSFPVDI